MSRAVRERQGRAAEGWAALYLRLTGWRILARRVKTPRGEIDHCPADRRPRRNGPAAQVIPVRKPARDADDVDPLRQRRFLVPDHDRSPAATGFEGHRKIAVAIGSGEDDDRSAHQAISIR